MALHIAQFEHEEGCDGKKEITNKYYDPVLRMNLIAAWVCKKCQRYMIDAKMFKFIKECERIVKRDAKNSRD